MRRLLKNLSWQAMIALIVPIVFFMACEKDKVELSGVPSLPTTFYPADGEVIDDLFFKFSASGSIVENENEIDYRYFVGTKKDSVKENPGNGHTPSLAGKQYFWRVLPQTYDRVLQKFFHGDSSEIFTFYTRPAPLKNVESDNGETETLVVLRWDEPENCQQVKITFSPECKEVAQPIIIPAGQDSCVISGLLDFNSLEHAFIKYTFTLEPDIKVGDKVISSKPVSIDEIPLNKTENVRDIDYNVYRCVRIGNQIWLAENLRTTRRQDGTKFREGKDYIRGSQSDVYGLYYQSFAFYSDNMVGSYIHITGPKGFKVATWDDWMLLFEEMGANVDIFDSLRFSGDRGPFLEDIRIAHMLKSQSGWPVVDGVDGNGIDYYHLGLLPGGYVDIESKEEFFVGENGYFFAVKGKVNKGKVISGLATYVYWFKPFSDGMFEGRLGRYGFNTRCVKNIE